MLRDLLIKMEGLLPCITMILVSCKDLSPCTCVKRQCPSTMIINMGYLASSMTKVYKILHHGQKTLSRTYRWQRQAEREFWVLEISVWPKIRVRSIQASMNVFVNAVP